MASASSLHQPAVPNTAATSSRRAVSSTEWETKTSLTDSQEAFLQRIAHPMDAVQLRDAQYKPEQDAPVSLSYYGFLEQEEMERQEQLKREARGAYEAQIKKLEMQAHRLAQSRKVTADTLDLVSTFQKVQQEASFSASALHDMCSTLQKNLNELSTLHTNLSQRLRYFEVPDSLPAFDEALAFLDAHPFYLEAKQTAIKFRILRSKMMASVRDGVIRALKRFSQQQMQAKKDGKEDDIPLMVLAAQLKPKIESLEDVFLQDVLSCYREWRIQCIDVPKFTGLDMREPFTMCLKVCRVEYELAASLFRDVSSISVPQLVSSFFAKVVDEVRPFIIRESQVEALAAFVKETKDGLLAQLIPQHAPGSLPLEPIVKQLMHDAQERLLFRAQVFIADEIRSYLPPAGTPELAYPDILIKQSQAQYTPVQRTVSLLRMLQPCLDASVFQALSYDAIEACCAACVAAPLAVGVDRELFLVRSLFFLNQSFERLHSYAIFADKTLDLSNLTAHFADLLKGRKSLLLWLTRGLQIREQRSDSKRDLDKETRKACENLVMEWTRLLLDPLLSHIAKAVALQKSRNTLTVADNSYLAREQVVDLMSRVVGHMEDLLPQIFKKLYLYLAWSPEVRRLLVAPVRQNTLDAFAQMSSLLQSHGVPEADRLEWGVLTQEALEMLFRDKEQQLVNARTAAGTS